MATGLILACDGVWDVFSEEAATEIVLCWPGDPQGAADALADAALAAGSRDNISVIVVTGMEQFSEAPDAEEGDEDPFAASGVTAPRGKRPPASLW